MTSKGYIWYKYIRLHLWITVLHESAGSFIRHKDAAFRLAGYVKGRKEVDSDQQELLQIPKNAVEIVALAVGA